MQRDLHAFVSSEGRSLLRAVRNERKLQILEEVALGNDTSSGIAQSLGISQTNASELLRRYWTQGLLWRYTAELNNEKIYEVTPKGDDRIEWLQKIFDESKKDSSVPEGINGDSIDLDELIKVLERCKLIRET
jgi:DNA-binding MarR family transcriptional regulator